MKVYTIHRKEDDLRVVREGFNLWACLFGFFWAICKGFWLVSVGVLVISTMIGLAFNILGLDLFGQAVVNIGFQVLFGLYANDLARWTLARRGYMEDGVIRAEDPDHALAQYAERPYGAFG